MRLSEGDAFRGQMKQKVRFAVVGNRSFLTWCATLNDVIGSERTRMKTKQMCQSLSNVVRWNLWNVKEATITWICSINIKSRLGKCIRQQCFVCHGVEGMKICQDLQSYIVWYWEVIFSSLFSSPDWSNPAQTIAQNEAVEKWVLGLRSNIRGASNVKESKTCKNEQLEKFSSIPSSKECVPPTSKVGLGVEE